MTANDWILLTIFVVIWFSAGSFLLGRHIEDSKKEDWYAVYYGVLWLIGFSSLTMGLYALLVGG